MKNKTRIIVFLKKDTAGVFGETIDQGYVTYKTHDFYLKKKDEREFAAQAFGYKFGWVQRIVK